MPDDAWMDDDDDEDEEDEDGGETEPATQAILTFECAGRIFALRIGEVGEIAALPDTTPLPESPRWIPGVATLRSRVVPVIDLRARLGLPAAPAETRPCVVLTHSETMPLALLIDEVRDVVNVAPERIMPPPMPGERGFVCGIGLLKDGVAVLIDPARLLDETEQRFLGAAVQAAIAAAEDQSVSERSAASLATGSLRHERGRPIPR